MCGMKVGGWLVGGGGYVDVDCFVFFCVFCGISFFVLFVFVFCFFGRCGYGDSCDGGKFHCSTEVLGADDLATQIPQIHCLQETQQQFNYAYLATNGTELLFVIFVIFVVLFCIFVL